MKKIQNLVVYLIIGLFCACSDGILVGQKMNELIKANGIVEISLISNEESATNALKYPVKNVVIENQFMKIDEVYYNLEKLHSMTVMGKTLELQL